MTRARLNETTKNPKNAVRLWFRRILKWLRSHFGTDADKRVKILETSVSPDKKTGLLSLSRDLVGASRTWKLNHAGANGSLFVTLDNLEVQRQYYKQERLKAIKLKQTYPVSADEQALYQQDYRKYTHRFGFFWCYWANGSAQLTPLMVVDADFSVNTLNSLMAKTRAIEVKDASIAKRIINTAANKVGLLLMEEIRDLPPSGKDWDTRVSKLEFCDLLLAHIRSYYRVHWQARLERSDMVQVRGISPVMSVDAHEA